MTKRRLSLETLAQRMAAKGFHVRMVEMPDGSRVLETLTASAVQAPIKPITENPWDRLLDGNA